jgi:glycogen(starch) synthase
MEEKHQPGKCVLNESYPNWSGGLSSRNSHHPRRVLMTADCVGGVWNYSLDLARALVELGVEVGIATMGPRPSQAQRAQATQISMLRLFESDYKLEWMDSPWADVDAAGIWLLDLARDFRPQIVHLNGFSHAALAWNAPVVVVVAHSCVRSWWNAVKTEPIPKEFAQYTRRVSAALRCASLLVAPTNAMLAAIEQNYDLSVPKKVIPNGRFGLRHLSAEKKDFILTAGRLWDEAKGLQFLAQIAPAVKWPIYAAGKCRHPSGSYISLQNIQLLGYLDNDKLVEYLSAASIYAAPALYEPFGLTVWEAAFFGCALVLSDIPSFRENWTDAALLIPTNDCAGWCAALNSLAEDHESRSTLARQAQNRAIDLRPEEIGSRYFATYCGLLADNPTVNSLNFQ